jgi:glycosyltransferase involved in cell wall biosynthesis
MLDPKRTAIVFTANTKQVAEANLFIESLRDPTRGNFQGDLWVISTDLSNRCMNVLDSLNIKHHVNPMMSLFEWNAWRQIAEVQPEFVKAAEVEKKKNRGACQYNAFLAYRNKRMSKLITIDWVNKFGERYDYMVLCDNDLFIQQDIHRLFEESYADNPETIHYWREERENLSGSWLWKKDFHYGRYHDARYLNWGKHEINIGFIMGKPEAMKWLFEQVREGFFSLNKELFIKHHWHDQDLCRLARSKAPDRFSLFPEGRVLHLCNGGGALLKEPFPLHFLHSKTGEELHIIHFAGGAWKAYPSVKPSYEVVTDHWFFEKEIQSAYNQVRENSTINIFDSPSKYFTENNIRRRNLARSKWRAKDQSKPKMLLHCWFSVKTHSPISEILRPLIQENSDIFNVAVLNGNVINAEYEGIVNEDIPNILAMLTEIIKDPFLVQQFGIRYSWMPADAFVDILECLRYEYGCTETEALAAANLLYFYFYDTLLYYDPDIVMIWGYYLPSGRIIRLICKELGIPVSSFEWSVLPGTITFDFLGHMGGSWPARHSGFFNTLPLSAEDVSLAEEYIKAIKLENYSRNVVATLDGSYRDRFQNLRDDGRKLLLYIESNNAHSGNIQANDVESRYHISQFLDDQEGYNSLLKFVQEHPEFHIVYKPHPISFTRGIKVKIDSSCTTVITKGSLEELFDFCDICITLLSAGAYSALIYDKPVIMLGKNQLNDSGAIYFVNEGSSLGHALDSASEIGLSEVQENAFIRHVARLLRYNVYSANNSLPVKRTLVNLRDDVLSIYQGAADAYHSINQKAYEEQLNKKERVNPDIPIVSVIMPIYNAEKYLSECLNSVLQQTLSDIEVICVNNGSTDDSQEILEYYAERDPRILIHYQEEPNQRTARNWGFENARGKYLYLIDSDDYIDLRTFEELVNACETREADVMYFFYREVHTVKNYARPRFWSFLDYLPDKNVFKMTNDQLKFFIQYPFPWAKLLRRDFVLENNLFFDEDCANFDDNPQNLRVLLTAKNAYVYNACFYNFRLHEKSMTQSSNPRILGMIDAVRIMNNIYSEKGRYAEFQPYYVLYKTHILSFAWDLLPNDLQEEYFNALKTLYLPSDSLFLDNDEVISTLGIPKKVYLDRMKRMLATTWGDFNAKPISKSVSSRSTLQRNKKQSSVLREKLKKITPLRKLVRRLRKFLRKL